jgi:valyl-tRNA synthetase
MLNSKYNHLDVEKDKYEIWKENGYFNAGDLSKKPFSIVIPPPNVTGKLHLGHAWDCTLQDIITRYKKMQGFDALWLPGMDHAGIATQAKVDERLKNMGIKPREIDRNDWLVYAWNWKEEYATIIREQWAKLGLCLDYNKERFTMDDGLNEAVNKVFIDYYNKGLIYRGVRAINWDTELMTALSNIEVEYKEEKGKMYYFKYMFPNSNEYIEVATTRPETLASDTALVVHPNDERYKHLIGKTIITPLRKEEVPIIADEYIDMSFGSGAMKCSAHAAIDVDILNKNKIEVRESINPDGRLNKNAMEFEGMTREDGRIAIVEKLQKEGLVTKIEDHIHQVGHSQRSNTVIETMVMPQWFVKMDVLAKQVLERQKTNDKVNFVPKRFEKILTNWMEEAYDWCISRQLWWGHQIPAWYKEDKIYVGLDEPKEEGWARDPDVLDTWFSSALWPFSTLGWPNETDDLKRYFPNDVLVTGYDIIFFWVSRMIFQSLELTDNIPFKEVLIHGLIRDNKGRKMSKSLGNGIDPMDVIENYGADSLRWFLTTNSAPGQDLRFDDEKIKSSWNFINKIWNASRFVLMNVESFNNETYDNLSISDKWILSKLNKTIKDITNNMEKYEFGLVGNTLYSFIWDDFCDWYIELSKFNQNDTTKSVLLKVLKDILKMLHPFMPFVTEEIYTKLPNIKESIMLEKYPVYDEKYIFDKEETILNTIIDSIKKIRTIQKENNISKEAEYHFDITNEFKEYETLIINILRIKNIINSKKTSNDEIIISTLIGDTYIYDEKIVYSIEEEINEKSKAIENLTMIIARRKNLLNNEKYINNAPSNIVELDKNKLKEEEAMLEILNNRLAELKKIQ